MEKDFSKQFTKCPSCGSEDRFFELLGQTLKDRKLARDEWNFHYEVKQGFAVDQQKAAAIPIGSEVPGYGIVTDVCMNCGNIYAVDLSRLDVKKSIAAAPPLNPNRAQRRRDGREGPPMINPISLS